ncbi:hypothetical protein OCE50_27915 [Bacillus wiedmannii]|uniref:hypothetical protein n=1 Tax=Bacillus wiedmannii TaxID=1890302 RepID=UPI0021CF375D|nr:hypothetical protein [Bacillus wiedmannii]MCU5414695.1 hypothetical protein [Bacillus wiedmannii]
MKSEIHPLRIIVSNEDVAVGNKVKFSDGAEGTVTSIRSIKFISMTKVEVIGRAKFENSTK